MSNVNIKDILKRLTVLFALKAIPTPPIPTPLILAAANRPGLSPILIANRIIARKKEAGLPIGNIETGESASDEIMIRIIVEEIINSLQTEAKIQTAIRQGTLITGAGGNAGGPIVIQGSTIGIGEGYSVIS